MPQRPDMLRITMRRLEVFVAVAECGGFRAAAERLGMAQPSVTAHVQALELESGGSLFDRRRGRGVILTDIGQTFLRHARQMLADAAGMTSDLRRAKMDMDRSIIFACQRSLSVVLAPVLASFAGQHRDVELITRVGRHEEVIEMIEKGTANLGLYLSNQDVPGLKSVVVGQEQLVIIAAPDHPLVGRRSVEPAELKNYSFVGPPDGSFLGQAMLQLLAGIGANDIPIVSRATEFEFLRALVIAGVGLYCCLQKRVQSDLADKTIVALPITASPLMLDVRQVFSVKREVSPSVALFAEFLRQQHRAEFTDARRGTRRPAMSLPRVQPIERRN